MFEVLALFAVFIILFAIDVGLEKNIGSRGVIYIGAPIAVLVISGVLLWVLGQVNIPLIVYHNWLYFLYGFGVYVVVGLLWSLIKWYFYCLGELRRLKEDKAAIFKRYKQEDAEVRWNTLRKDWKNPSPDDHISRICRWIILWPVSIVSFLLADMLKEIGLFAYNRIKGLMQLISNYVFSSID